MGDFRGSVEVEVAALIPGVARATWTSGCGSRRSRPIRAYADDVRASAAWLVEALRRTGFPPSSSGRRQGTPRSSPSGRAMSRLRRPSCSTATTTSSRSTRWSCGRARRSSPTIRGEELFARGAIDDKGQVLFHLLGLRRIWRRPGGRRPAVTPEGARRGRGGVRLAALRRVCCASVATGCTATWSWSATPAFSAGRPPASAPACAAWRTRRSTCTDPTSTCTAGRSAAPSPTR